MITVVLFRDGKPMRYFPIAAKGATHVALRVVEDLLADTVLELFVAAPADARGTVIVDLGLVEVNDVARRDSSSSATAWRACARSRRSWPAAAPTVRHHRVRRRAIRQL